MKIKVIGSGSMWTKYNSACFLIDDDIMIDFPNGACKYLYRCNIKPSSIDYVLITHLHGDHYFDVPFYILNKSKSRNKECNIYCTKEGQTKIDKLGLLAFVNSYEDACSAINLRYNYQNEFKIKNYQVKKVLVDHGRMKPSYGYVFSTDKLTVSFTGDTTYCESVENMASVSDYLFCDCMKSISDSKHMGIDSLTKLTKHYPKCTFVVCHLDDSTREKLIKLKIKNVIIPNDYQELKIKDRK